MKPATAMLLTQTDRDVWMRGEQYARTGRVEIESHDDRRVQATVLGTESYDVTLKYVANGISRTCECAYFNRTGYVCKHIVAAAICWDQLRGLAVPDKALVDKAAPKTTTIPRRAINSLFERPLDADLLLLRDVPDITALGGRGRPHSDLPEAPRALSVFGERLVRAEVKKCFTEIKSWSRRRAYDPYFCAGEMIAAFCEVMRTVRADVGTAPPLVVAQILLDAQEFHRTLVMELIDDSLGLRSISTAYLEDTFESLSQVAVGDKDAGQMKKLLRDFERAREYE
ncbi:MAG: SWIM zinc finger family protein [Candidatus Zixiibacteriota bacterium]